MSPNVPESKDPHGVPLDSETVLVASTRTTGAPPALKAEEELLLALADGRVPVSEIIRMAGLPGSVSMRVLRSLVERGLLKAVSRAEASGQSGQGTHPGRVRLTQDLTTFVGRLKERQEQGAADPWPERVRMPSSDSPRTLMGLEPIVSRRAGSPAAPSGDKGDARSGTLFTSGVIERPVNLPDPALDNPTRVGAYEVVARMAQGGLGSIYLCRREGMRQFQRLYALKVIRQHSQAAEAAARSFLREARVAALLSHPNVLAIVDVGHYQQQPFLLMDYVEGTSLGHLLFEGTRCPSQLIVPVILDVLRGLQCAHDLTDAGRVLGLVHGDLSPDNILVGTDGVARVADFGSARFTALGEDDGEMGTMGKPAYMAPEQLKGEPIDARTDLFAVGVVLWIALTGRKLFVEQSYEQTVMNVLRRPVQPPSAFGGPRLYDDFCLKALSRNPAARFQTAEEMAAALYRLAAEEAILPAGAAVGAWVRQHMSEVLSERRQRLRDLANGDSEPVIVAADGFADDEPAVGAKGPREAAPKATVALLPVAPSNPVAVGRTEILRPPTTTSSAELQAINSPLWAWLSGLLARLRGRRKGD